GAGGGTGAAAVSVVVVGPVGPCPPPCPHADNSARHAARMSIRRMVPSSAAPGVGPQRSRRAVLAVPVIVSPWAAPTRSGPHRPRPAPGRRGVWPNRTGVTSQDSSDLIECAAGSRAPNFEVGDDRCLGRSAAGRSAYRGRGRVLGWYIERY